jgi:L-aspartate semialdehyde sulfurtransferase
LEITKSYDEINQKIKEKKAVVMTADEMKIFVKENGIKKAAEKVDVVTTGTFGAMCSSGAFLNFGHDDPPLKMERVLMNGVTAYGGIAAVDAYIGATQASESKGYNYGGAHVIEDLVSHKPIILEAEGKPTDCYPGKSVRTKITIDDINEAILVNPRNAYQRYNAASNSTNETKYTYMGKLLPNCNNITFSGAGEISPINNDPDFETIGIGTRIFLGGAQGYIINSGTQHNPKSGFSTLMVMGNLKEMDPEYIRAAILEKYGCSLFVGIGVPIPILNENIARKTAILDSEILTDILDYGVPSRQRPALKSKVSYADLKSGIIEIGGKKIKCASISSLYYAKKITKELKTSIEAGEFLISKPVQNLRTDSQVKPLKVNNVSDKIVIEARKYDKVTYLSERCTKCELCISLCPFDAIHMNKADDIEIDYDMCTECGSCLEFCPMRCFKV